MWFTRSSTSDKQQCLLLSLQPKLISRKDQSQCANFFPFRLTTTKATMPPGLRELQMRRTAQKALFGSAKTQPDTQRRCRHYSTKLLGTDGVSVFVQCLKRETKWAKRKGVS